MTAKKEKEDAAAIAAAAATAAATVASAAAATAKTVAEVAAKTVSELNTAISLLKANQDQFHDLTIAITEINKVQAVSIKGVEQFDFRINQMTVAIEKLNSCILGNDNSFSIRVDRLEQTEKMRSRILYLIITSVCGLIVKEIWQFISR